MYYSSKFYPSLSDEAAGVWFDVSKQSGVEVIVDHSISSRFRVFNVCTVFADLCVCVFILCTEYVSRYVCMHACVYVHIFVCMYECVNPPCMHVMPVCTYACICTFMYVRRGGSSTSDREGD